MRTATGRNLRTAFSLVELLIVVAVVSILAGAVLPLLSPGVPGSLQSAAAVVAADLSAARDLAVANNSYYTIQFDFTNNRYVLAHSGDNPALDTLPPGPPGTDSTRPNERIMRLDDLPSIGARVRLVTVEISSEDDEELDSVQRVSRVRFGPYGQTTRPEKTTVWLAAGYGDGQLFIPIDIHPVTGLATVGALQTEPPITLHAPLADEDELDDEEIDADESYEEPNDEPMEDANDDWTDTSPIAEPWTEPANEAPLEEQQPFVEEQQENIGQEELEP